MTGITRRSVIHFAALAGGAIWVGACSPDRRREGDGSRPDWRCASFLKLSSDGSAVVYIPVPEIGQGVRTALAMLVIEELDFPWEHVRVEQAEIEGDLGPHPFAGGSRSVRAYWDPLRRMGATARDQLIRAASAAWAVPTSSCATVAGAVVHIPTSRRASYQELLEGAGRLSPRSGVDLRARATWHLIGTPRVGVDVREIVTGRRTYGSDVRLPGMRFATVLRSPVFGGRLVGLDATAALRVPGVLEVRAIEPWGVPEAPTIPAGAAVIAADTWSAMRGRAALEARWDPGPNVHESTSRLRELCLRALDTSPSASYRERGSPPTVGRRRTVKARYHLPFLAHVPMETPACTVRFQEDRCEIWAPTQMPVALRREVAEYLGWPEDRVIVHVTAIGGGFGRRLDADFVLEAVAAARSGGDPIHVSWSRADDLHHGFFRPYSWHQLEGELDSAGRIVSWTHHQAGTSRYAFRDNLHPGESEFRGGVWPATLLARSRLLYSLVASAFDRGPLRAPGFNALVFAVESFLDELAWEAGFDPLAFRLAILDPPRTVPTDDDSDPFFDTARLARCLRTVADAASWSSPRAPGVGVGLAGAFVFGSYAAHAIEVAVDRESGVVRPLRAWSALDCGTVVNPLGARAQVEGGLVDGISAALFGEITIVEGRVQQTNLHDYRLLTLSQAPDVEVHLLPSEEPPTGAGEAPYPPALPALANAIFAAVGARVRELPIHPARVLAALKSNRGK